jgi:hypothetical protein
MLENLDIFKSRLEVSVLADCQNSIPDATEQARLMETIQRDVLSKN